MKVKNIGKDKIIFFRLKCIEYYKHIVMMIVFIQIGQLLHHWAAFKLEMMSGYGLNLVATKD